ncbi:MAG: hypothetical protein ACJ8G3_12825 [Burkholderiaceae bacterium]
MSIDDKSASNDGQTIVPSHNPMPGVDDEIIDGGRKTGAQLPPADETQHETRIDWNDTSRAPEAADGIRAPEPGRK